MRLPLWEVVTLGVWFCVIAALATYFPRSGDDWAWGSKEGLDRLPSFFQGINGRYAGNLTVLLLVRSGAIAALVVAAAMCATGFLILHIASNRTPIGYGLVATLLLMMPRGIWRESVVWLSGFVNYSLGAIALLCFLALAQAEWRGRPEPLGGVRLMLVAVAGFIGQLFVEHITLAICALGIGLSLKQPRRAGARRGYTAVWTAAALAGAVVMFSNSAYRRVAAGGPGYQKAQQTSGPDALRDLAEKAFDYLPTQAVSVNLGLNVAFAVCLMLLALAGHLDHIRRSRLVFALSSGFLVVASTLWLCDHAGRGLPLRVHALLNIAAVLLAVSSLVAALAFIESRQSRWIVTVGGASFLLAAGPLLLVNPIGPRCFYPTYLVLVLVTVTLARAVQDQLTTGSSRALSAVLHGGSAVLLAAMFSVYATIDHAADQRLRDIRRAVQLGQSDIVIAPLPHPTYVHDGDPFWSVLQKQYKAYHRLPADVKITLTPNPWLKPAPKPAP